MALSLPMDVEALDHIDLSQLDPRNDAEAAHAQYADYDEGEVSAELEEMEEAMESLDENSLLELIKKGKEDDVRKELEQLSVAAILNEKDALDCTALHYAAKYNHCNIIELLLKLDGIDPEVKTDYYNDSTALHLAATHGCLEAVKLLLDPTKFAGTQDSDDLLVSAKVDSVNTYDQTPLHIASRKGHVEIVTVLLEYGAQVDKVDTSGRTPLHFATKNSHVSVAEVLLQHGASVDKEDNTGIIPLHLASERDTAEMVVFLLKYGADINKVDNDDKTALHFACRSVNVNMNKEVVTALLEHGASVTKTDSSGETPLQYASSWHSDSSSDIVEILLEYGADVNIALENGITPLVSACFIGSARTAAVLLKHGADKDKRTAPGLDTPLHFACQWGHTDVVKVLLMNHASVTKRNSNGLNPLMLAIQEGHEDVVKTCLGHESWKKATRICANGTTPMREMIKRMPDVAAVALDCCTETSSIFAKGNTSFSVTFDYALVEDFQDSIDVEEMMNEVERIARGDDEVDDRSCLSKIFPKYGGFTTIWGPTGFKSSEHPLNLMAQSENLKLLKHPLVTTLLRRKWRVTQFVYLANLLFYCTFLAFLTAFALTAPNPQSFHCANATVNTTGLDGCGQSRGRQQFVIAAGVITVILAIARFVTEGIQMIQHKVEYFTDWVNWMEVTMAIFSIIFVWVFSADCLCPARWQWQIGVIAVFLAWTDFIIFVQKLPGVGIYVGMLVDILWIFIKTIPLTIMLVIAFGLGLFMAFFEPGVLRSPFSTPARSLLSVVTYSTGGFDFDAIFRQAPGATTDDNDLGEIPFPSVSYVMWIIFIIIMPILLNNLLIGLAVGDINETLKKAEGKKVALEIELTLSVQATLPAALRRKFIVGSEELYPNDSLSLKKTVEKLVWGADRFPTGSNIVTAIKKEDKDPVKLLPRQLLFLTKDVLEMKRTVSSLSQDVREMKNMMKEFQDIFANKEEK